MSLLDSALRKMGIPTDSVVEEHHIFQALPAVRGDDVWDALMKEHDLSTLELSALKNKRCPAQPAAGSNKQIL